VAEKKEKKKKEVKEKKVQMQDAEVKTTATVKKSDDVAKSEKVNVKKDPSSKQEIKTVYARAKYINMSARKARLVIDLIRGKNALEAVHLLEFVNKSAALPIQKALNSAISNADNNFEFDKKSLIIAEAFIDDAPILKRGRAGSRGRYKKLLKRNCHITIGVAEK